MFPQANRGAATAGNQSAPQRGGELSTVFVMVLGTVDNSRRVPADRAPGSYFHCVETTNPPAMKPNPTTMFQAPSAPIGRSPWAT